MDNEIKVLDHGFVKLIDSMGNDMSIVKSARVSYKGLYESNKLTDKDKKLITSLITRKHTSPFECVQFTFAVKAPIFVLRQWHRHRTWSFNEVSARYKKLDLEFYVPKPEHVGYQMKHEKQMSNFDKINPSAKNFIKELKLSHMLTKQDYEIAIHNGIPRERARLFMPVSTYSEMYASVNLHNLVHFLKLRCDEHAQYEIRVYANAMLELAKQVVPYSMNEFEKIIKNT